MLIDIQGTVENYTRFADTHIEGVYGSSYYGDIEICDIDVYTDLSFNGTIKVLHGADIEEVYAIIEENNIYNITNYVLEELK